MSDKKTFDWGMHYFRAFAILAIMATHYAASFGYTKLVSSALTSSTIYFLFISGYLCQFIDAKRRDQPTVYYRKKLTNVICPFLIFSLVFAALKGQLAFSVSFLKTLLCGQVQGQYWYIPFVSFLFLASPLFCRLGNRTMLAMTGIALALFFVFPFRPDTFTIAWPDTFYLYSYFSVFYLLGFVYFRYRDRVDVWLKRFCPLTALGAVVLLVLLWTGVEMSGRCHGWAVCGQRFLTMCVALVALSYLRDKRITVLDLLAQYSFTLYFIHFGLYALTHGVHDRLIALSHLPAPLADVVLFFVYLALMMGIAVCGKKVLGRFSRMVMGS